MMNWTGKIAGVLLSGMVSGTLYAQLTVTPDADGARIATERLEMEIRDGMIVRIVNRTNGEVLTESAAADTPEAFAAIPAGLGLIAGDPEAMSRIHIQWGNLELDQYHRLAVCDNYHRPVAQSRFECLREDGGVTLQWTGLGNARGFFPGEKLQIRLSEDEHGALVLETTGNAPAGGIFGVQTPLVGLSGRSRVVLPHFGGMEFSGAGPEGLMPCGGAPFSEAPVAAVECGDSALGLWIEDPHFGPYYTFLGRIGGTVSLALEPLNLMPYEPKTAMTPVKVKLDVVTGDWKAALTPFRNWYRKRFAAELAVRDGVDWAARIHTVSDVVPAGTAERLARYFPPEAVLCHDWNGRAPDFDTELPDWTPRAGYVKKVAELHQYGFKTMAYINTYCVNYNSPVFRQEKLADCFLTRKNAIYQYRSGRHEGQVSELLTGTIVAGGTAEDPYRGIPDGSILYGDPLSPAWRAFHVRQAKEWNDATGTDANYEDTAGCAGDFGNGVIDGLSAGEGSVAQMRLLQQTQPNVPMASEYGPAEIAFAIRWPLNYAQVWGNDDFRRYRIHHQLPVTAFLYGYTAWVPAVGAESDFLKHVIGAVSDAAGGMGMVMGSSFADPDDGGMSGLLTLRAQIFAGRQLRPYFPDGRYPEHIRCMYQGIDGIYSYYDDGHLQQLLDPSGRPLYGRLDGVNAYDIPGLALPNWPGGDGSRIEGLDPERSYALFPADGQTASIRVKDLDDGLRIRRFYTIPETCYLELSGDRQKEGAFTLQFQTPPEQLRVNGQPVAPAAELRIAARPPIRVAAFFPVPQPGDSVLKVSPAGVVEGVPAPLAETATIPDGDGEPLYFVNYFQSKLVTRVVKELPPNAALAFRHRNRSDRYGNGSIVRVKIDGVTVYEFDCAPVPGQFDTEEHDVRIPIPPDTRTPFLVTVEVDNKGDSNADAQYIGIPKTVQAMGKLPPE